jgi:hypothetical protein
MHADASEDGGTVQGVFKRRHGHDATFVFGPRKLTVVPLNSG